MDFFFGVCCSFLIYHLLVSFCQFFIGISGKLEPKPKISGTLGIPEMSGIDVSELISDSIFKNLNLTKPEIPDSNISDNPNAHPYSSPSTSLRSMDTLLTLLSIFWMKE